MKSHQLMASLDIRDEEIVKYITAEDPNAILDPQKVKEMAQDPEWVSRIFQSGMNNIFSRAGTASSAKLSKSMFNMLFAVDDISVKLGKEGKSPSSLLDTYRTWMLNLLP